MDIYVVMTLAIGILFLLLAAGVPVAFALGAVGASGLLLVRGIDVTVGLLSIHPYKTIAVYMFTVIPLFIIMGDFAKMSGVTQGVFNAAYKWFGRLPGGLGLATIAACAGFAACCGSSPATAAAIGKIAIPEMRRYGYSAMFSTGCVAAGGTLGILIPPSALLILYGIVTEESIGKLFMAGIVPGILSAAIYWIGIIFLCKLRPNLAPQAPPGVTRKERLTSLTGIWGVGLLAVIIIGGIYGGIFTATESAAIGALAALLMGAGAWLRKPSLLRDALAETCRTTCMVFTIMMGAGLFAMFMTYSGATGAITTYLVNLPLPPLGVLAVVLVMYIPLGMFLDPASIVFITVPLVYPPLTKLGFDGIWFGIIFTKLIEIAEITPPLGFNVYVIKGIAPDVELNDIFRGVGFFLCLDIFTLATLVVFPQIVLFLPQMMR